MPDTGRQTETEADTETETKAETETDIETWLTSAQARFDIVPPLDSASLPTSGPQLCSLTQTDWVSLAGAEAGVLLYKYLVCLREPFTGETFVEPAVPLPSYLPRTKRPSSSCSISSLPLSALSPAASLSSSNSVLSGKYELTIMSLSTVQSEFETKTE